MGLGEALRRLLDVEIRFRHGLASPELKSERDMLLVALNRVEIQLGFDCDNDGAPDTVDIFRETSETSCCRIIDLPNVRPIQRLEVASSRAEDPPKKVEAPAVVPAVVKPAGPGFFGKIFAAPDKKPEEKK